MLGEAARRQHGRWGEEDGAPGWTSSAGKRHRRPPSEWTIIQYRNTPSQPTRRPGELETDAGAHEAPCAEHRTARPERTPQRLCQGAEPPPAGPAMRQHDTVRHPTKTPHIALALTVGRPVGRKGLIQMRGSVRTTTEDRSDQRAQRREPCANGTNAAGASTGAVLSSPHDSFGKGSGQQETVRDYGGG